MYTSTTVNHEHHHGHSRSAWGAVIAGLIIALSFTAFLNLIGVGLGFTSFSVDSDTMKAIGVGSVIWLIVSGVIAMFFGGWVTGKFAHCCCRATNAWHGLVTWGLTMLITFALMATTLGMLVSGTASLVGSGLSAAGQTAAAVGQGAANMAPQVAQNIAPNLAPAIDQIKQQAQDAIANAANNSTANSQNNNSQNQNAQLGNVITNWLTNEDQNNTSAQEAVVKFLMTNANMSQQQAEQTVAQWQQKYNDLKAQAKQKAINATEKTTTALGGAALVTALILLLTGIASVFGSVCGAKCHRREETPVSASPVR